MDKELGFINIKVEEDYQIKINSNIQVPDIIVLLKSITAELEQEDQAKEE